MEILKQNLDKVKVPTSMDKIFKDECVFSFDTPETETGLYICLNTFLGFGKDFVEIHHQKTGNCIYLHMKKTVLENQKKSDGGEGELHPKKITKLGIGIEGGYKNESKKPEHKQVNSIVILPQFIRIPLPNEDVPQHVNNSVAAIIVADSAFRQEELQSSLGTWDGEKRQVSKHASNLAQYDNGVKIPPRGWKCEKCDMKENLWLNLTDGSILCGRKFFDGTGGNNHAVEHFNHTKLPLAVKLGTITSSGGDVYSYDEDEMVEDPELAKHLEHFGINITKMEKTEKSMIELELDYNQKIGEWSVMQESESKLIPLYGSGFTGLKNLGNSCYMNSVMQMIFSIPDFQNRYNPPFEMFKNSPADPTQDFNCQMAKLGYGLLSGKYSKKTENVEDLGISPTMFKNLIGKGHTEFSTKRQQDVQEFFLHLINLIERNCHINGHADPAECLKFQIEERIECLQSHKVLYTTRTEYMLPLPISLKNAVNAEEVEVFNEKKKILDAKGEIAKEIVRPKILLQDCFDGYSKPEIVDDFYSTAIDGKTAANKSTKMKTFPPYLMLQMKKFALDDNWVPKKLDVSVEVPDIIDLVELRGKGLQTNETSLPEIKPGGTNSEESEDSNSFNFDVAVLNQLSEMGFKVDACKRAIYNTQNTGVESALNWLFEHQGEPDFDAPFVQDTNKNTAFIVDIVALESLKVMGLTEHQSRRGLKETNNNVERALDWIFSHQNELESEMQVDSNEAPMGASGGGPVFRDGSEKYKLFAFVSHMGTSTMCGHYVCHIFKDNKWVIFNDEKVAISENPPKDLAYLYLYKRL